MDYMTPRLKLGIDMDGVLADFNTEFFFLLDASCPTLCSSALPADRYMPDFWDWPLLYSERDRARAWEQVRQSFHFWENLAPLPDAEAFLSALPYEADIYFITQRSRGRNIKKQTERWLMRYGLPGRITPTVLLVESPGAKGAIAAALQLTHFIDDRPENCEAVRHASPQTLVAMLDAPYNRTWLWDGGRYTSPLIWAQRFGLSHVI